MPKINVYLPDELAAAVRDAGIPVSPICQKALAEAVRTVTLARRSIEAIRDPDVDPAMLAQIANRLDGRMTKRLRDALRLAGLSGLSGQAAGGPVRTGHLLIGILDEGENLAIRLLRLAEVDTDELREAAATAATAATADTDEPMPAATGGDDAPWSRLSRPARLAMAGALEAALDLGHNYLGCEHLLLGLLADTGSGAGVVFQRFGLEAAAVRRSVTAALAGFAQAKQAAPDPAAGRLDEVLRRLEAIEGRLSTAGL